MSPEGKNRFPAPLPNPLAGDDRTDPYIRGSATPATSPPPTEKMPHLGPLDSLVRDQEITEIMVNDLRNVIIERGGKLSVANVSLRSQEDLQHLVRIILEAAEVPEGALSPEHPYLDASLPDGSRVNVVIPPLAPSGPCITIRKFPAKRLGIDELMASGMLDRRIGYFLNVCVVAKINILISGGTGTGKTTFLNALAGFIPRGERVVTIEDTPELVISHTNSVRLITQPPALGPGVSAREMVANALRMRPDRILVGESRRGEALDVLQAMNTGHSGSMTTLHANSTRNALSRLETLCMMAGIELPLLAVRKQISDAIDLIIHLKRYRDGKRRIEAVSEVTGMEGDTVTLQDIFHFDADAKAPGQPEPGYFRPLGFVPTFNERLRELGLELPAGYFG